MLNLYSENKKSEKKHHKKGLKEHSKTKTHKSKRRHREHASSRDSITQRSSSPVSTESGTEPYISCQSNLQSIQNLTSLQATTSKSVHSAQSLLKNNNNNCPPERTSETANKEKGKNKGILSEDRQLVENMYMKIMNGIPHMRAMALEMRETHLKGKENMKIIEGIAAKYRIPLPPLAEAGREGRLNSNQTEDIINTSKFS